MEPDIVQETVLAGPKFPVGMPVKIDGYYGVLSADETCRARHRILSLRLIADVSEAWVGTEDDGHYRDTVTYPAGWEYLVVRSRRLSDEWGWVREEDLVKNGYTPTDEPIPFVVTPLVARIAGPGVEDLADLEVPPLSEVDPEPVTTEAGR